jgi:APA family basic amino acid/polyamine antiporter
VAAVRPAALTATAAIPLSLGGTTASVTLALWALLGLESATIPASKVRDPSRTIPRATVFGTVLTALICMLACTAVIFLVPPQTLVSSNAPFVDLATQYWGVAAGKVLAVFAAISGFGALNGWILLQGELPNVMAKHGEFPRVFAQESARLTPTFALIFSSCLVSALILLNYQKSMASIFSFMILLSTASCLVLYLTCALALLRLAAARKIPAPAGRTISLAVLAVTAALYSLWAIVGAGAEIIAWGAGLLLLGAPAYFLMRSTGVQPA